MYDRSWILHIFFSFLLRREFSHSALIYLHFSEFLEYPIFSTKLIFHQFKWIYCSISFHFEYLYSVLGWCDLILTVHSGSQNRLEVVLNPIFWCRSYIEVLVSPTRFSSIVVEWFSTAARARALPRLINVWPKWFLVIYIKTHLVFSSRHFLFFFFFFLLLCVIVVPTCPFGASNSTQMIFHIVTKKSIVVHLYSAFSIWICSKAL